MGHGYAADTDQPAPPMSEDAILIVDPGGTSDEARSIYVWIVEHGPGDEAIPAVDNMPMMAAQYRVALRLAPIAQRMATATGKTLKLVRYDAVQTLEVCAP